MDRIQKILSQAGIASRRASERLMLDGRVSVNGITVRELGTKADPRDDIRVDGRRIRLPERHRYVLLNKPRGYVTTRSDPEHRPTVIDLIGATEYIYPVGRLDFDSEGLLILTNDGDLAARLTHPSHGIERVYEARVLGVPDEHDLSRLRRGIPIEGRRTGPADVEIIGRAQGTHRARAEARAYVPHHARAKARAYVPHHARAEARAYVPQSDRPARHETAQSDRPARHETGKTRATLRITVREGRNRQIRKMCEAIGHPVDRLRRVAIGPIRDERLKVGQWRELTGAEVNRLRAATVSTRRISAK
jgi:23S rRNA pseudouridine2605 synthase